MVRFYYWIWVLMVGGLCFMNVANAQIPQMGLVGYWPFDGNANDMSGNGNHGTLGGANGGPSLTTDRFGNANSCYEFGGYYHKNWIDVPNSISLQFDTTLSVSFWVQECFRGGTNGYGQYSTTEYNYGIIAKGGDGWSCPPGLWIYTSHDANNPDGFTGLVLNNSTSSATYAIHDFGPRDNCVPVNDCDWLHCVVVIEGHHLTFYFNNVMVMDTIYPNSVNFVAANNQDMHFGIEGGHYWNPRDGKLDDIAIYNRAISPAEVAQLYGQFYDEHAFDHPITIDSIHVVKTCNDALGMAQVFPDINGGPYQYALDSPTDFQSSNVLQNISSGIHQIFVRTECGMKDTLIDFTGPVVTITATSDTICEGEAAILQAIVPGGVPVFYVPTVAIGDILCTDNSIVKPTDWPVPGKTAMGVVCYVDSTGEHGWAVHRYDQATSLRWTPNGQNADVPDLTNYSTALEAITDFDGYNNTLKIRAAGNSTQYPAAYAVDINNDWYLPAIGQLRIIYSEFVILNASLQIIGGSQFPMEMNYYYLSSSEHSEVYAWYVNYFGYVYPSLKNNTGRVRSVRSF